MLLVHGFPQTSYQFRRVITPIANAGYTAIVPDYRGAGASSKPWNGYTKEIMAQDLHTLLQKIGVKERLHLVGHDIGMLGYSSDGDRTLTHSQVAWSSTPTPNSFQTPQPA